MSVATVTVPRQQLAKALARLDKVVAHRSPKEVLQCLKISINGHFQLSATDAETQTIESLNCYSKSGEAIAIVNAKQFRKTVTSSKEKEVEIGIDGDSLSMLGATMTAVDVEKNPFPAIAIDANGAKSNTWIDGKRLANMLDYTAIATDPNSSRFCLGAVCIEFNAEDITTIATDGRRLHSAKWSGAKHEATASALLHVNNAEQLAAAARVSDSVCLTILLNDIVAVCYSKGEITTEFKFRQVDGRFPNWRQVIPANLKSEYRLRADMFELAANRVSNFLGNRNKWSEDIPRHAEFIVLNDDMHIRAIRADKSTIEQKTPIAYRSEDAMNIALDSHFMADIVPAGCDLFTIGYEAENLPVKIGCEVDSVKFESVVMPVQRPKAK